MNIFKRAIFFLTRPCIVLTVGKGRACAKEACSKVLSNTLIFESENAKEVKRFSFLLKNSRIPILIATHVGEIPPNRNFFDGGKKDASSIRKLADALPHQGFLILNYDDETIREIKNKTIARSLTFGFQKGADFQATDINYNIKGTNFKINYQGKSIPFWIKRVFGKEQIYTILSAVCLGTVKGLNLIEISQSLKSYQSLPGKMKLINGVKQSLILDDSENATDLSMIEALDILKRIGQGRKIAVLGDVLKSGKYTASAHEAIGEQTAKTADLLFAIGLRAKFIVQGAKRKGMKQIFQFNTVEEAKLALQREIKQGDLILIDGSKEMKMGQAIEEIRT